MNLTDREIEIVRLVADGLKPQAVARVLGISARTVQHTLGRMYGKTGTWSRTSLVIWWLTGGCNAVQGLDAGRYIQVAGKTISKTPAYQATR